MSENCTHDCSTCSSACASRTAPQDLHEKPNEYTHVKKVIGVVSGKGGVGKSLVTSLLAVLTARQGYQTAILDADMTGPSIPLPSIERIKAVSSPQTNAPAPRRILISKSKPVPKIFLPSSP